METNHGKLFQSSRLQKVAYYLLVSIILGIGIFLFVQSISQFWK
ncbi:MAG: hypothetical protein FD147_517 [Chloroflexi bacterium]|nr:MAG: hypothetical protein FD147_517 [Chloroflexota bacterium]